MEGSEQVRTVLDMTADAWKKVYLTEDWPESINNVLGLFIRFSLLPQYFGVLLPTMVSARGKFFIIRVLLKDDFTG